MNAELTSSMLLAASTVQTTGVVVAVLAMIGFVAYVLFNIFAGRREVGSEIELAPNRKPYLDDEKLETTRLNNTLLLGLAFLGVSAIGLPLYWLHEPGRQDGAVEMFQETFIKRGERQYESGSDCAACHGPNGTGATATYTLMDPDTDEFVATVAWLAPALDTAALRFSREELTRIVEYGRPGTPMAGWGAGGDGPLSPQQIDDVVHYLFSIARPADEVQQEVREEIVKELGLVDADEDNPEVIQDAWEGIDFVGDTQVGEMAFNMNPALGSGAYACARCHTRGWSLVTDTAIPEDADLTPYVDFPDGSGAFGWSLENEVPRQFATVDELAEFISMGSVEGQGYGRQGQGTGRMPAFGDNPNTDVQDDGMFPRELVCAVATYVATLQPEGGAPADELPPFTEEDGYCTDVVEASGGLVAPGPANGDQPEDAESEPGDGDAEADPNGGTVAEGSEDPAEDPEGA